MFKKKVGRPSNAYKRKVRNIKILGALSIISIVGITIFTFNNMLKNNKLKGDINDTQEISMFLPGKEVNKKIHLLTGNEGEFSTVGNLIRIKRSKKLGIIPNEQNIVSTNDSKNPIYMWYKNETIYWYCLNKKVLLNPNSSFMFSDIISLKKIDVSDFDTSKVTNMNEMFSGCESLKNLNLSSFDTSNVEDMSGMFEDCESLKSINLSSFDTSNVTDMSSMFAFCDSLDSLNIKKFDTTKVKNFEDMFINSKIQLKFKIGINHGKTPIDKKVITMKKNGKLGLNYVLYPINIYDLNVEWTSSDSNVVSIDYMTSNNIQNYRGIQLVANKKSSEPVIITIKYPVTYRGEKIIKTSYLKVKVDDKGIDSPEGYDISSTNTSYNNQVNQTKQKTIIKNSTSKPTLVTTMKINNIDSKSCKKHGITFTIDSTNTKSDISKVEYSIDNKKTWKTSNSCTITGKKAVRKINKKYKSIFYKVETANNHYQVFGDYCTK